MIKNKKLDKFILNMNIGRIIIILVFLSLLSAGCIKVPKEKKWGIYELDLKNNEVKLIYSSLL